MRRIALIATAVAMVLGLVAVAHAANTYTVTQARVTPTNSGTATNPKPVRVEFGYSVGDTAGNRPSVTTDYTIGFGPGIVSRRSLFLKCPLRLASSNSCPANTKVGSGIVDNLAGSAADPSQKIPCRLSLTVYNGDGALYPPAQNDGRRIRGHVYLGLKQVPGMCPLQVDAVIAAQFVAFGGGTALQFHVPRVPFQQPVQGIDNSVVSVTSSVFKTRRVSGRTRGFFESTRCANRRRTTTVVFRDASGATTRATRNTPCSP